MEDEDNIIPYETSPSLTVKQAVMFILGYRGEYKYFIPQTEEVMEFDLYDYLHHLQEEADSAYGNASYDLEMLKRGGDATPEELQKAEERVAAAKAELEQANKLPGLAEDYRLLINHEISRVRLGKRSPLVIDEDESATGPLRVNKESFLEWLDGLELEDSGEVSAPRSLSVDEDSFCQELSSKSAESLYVTLGLLVSLFAESRGGKFGSGQDPKVINIAQELSEYAKELNGGHPLHGQGTQAIRKRIEPALRAVITCI